MAAGKEIRSQVRKLARNAVSLALGGIVAQIAFTLLEVLIARKLGAEAYGIFVTAYAWTVLGAFFMEWGTPLWTIQEGSRNHARLPGLMGAGLSVNFVMFGLLYVLLVAVVYAFAPNPVLRLMLILLPYGLILTMQNVLAAVFSSYQTMQVNAFFQGLAPVAILAVYFVYSAGDVGLDDVGFAYIIGGGLVTGAWFGYTLRRITPRVSAVGIRETLRSSYQYGLSGILGQIYFKSDVVMLSALAGLKEAGIYAAAFKLVDLVYKVAVLSVRVFAPAIFKASHESDTAFGILASMMMRFLAIAGLLAGIASFVLADELIMLLFGDEYLESVPVLQILGGVMAVKCMMIALQLLLSSIDLHVERVVGLGVTVIAHIGANALLIPRFGALGAAFATLFSGVLIVVLYAVSSSRQAHFHYLKWLLMPSCLAGVISFVAAQTGLNAYFGTAFAVAAFLLSLILIGFVRRDEVVFVFRSIVSRGET